MSWCSGNCARHCVKNAAWFEFETLLYQFQENFFFFTILLIHKAGQNYDHVLLHKSKKGKFCPCENPNEYCTKVLQILQKRKFYCQSFNLGRNNIIEMKQINFTRINIKIESLAKYSNI